MIQISKKTSTKESENKAAELEQRVAVVYMFTTLRKLLKKIRQRVFHILIVNALIFIFIFWVFDTLHHETLNKVVHSYYNQLKYAIMSNNIQFLSDFIAPPDFQLIVSSDGLVMSQPVDVWLYRPIQTLYDPQVGTALDFLLDKASNARKFPLIIKKKFAIRTNTPTSYMIYIYKYEAYSAYIMIFISTKFYEAIKLLLLIIGLLLVLQWLITLEGLSIKHYEEAIREWGISSQSKQLCRKALTRIFLFLRRAFGQHRIY